MGLLKWDRGFVWVYAYGMGSVGVMDWIEMGLWFILCGSILHDMQISNISIRLQ